MKEKDARSLSAEAQEAIRKRAVDSVLNGMKQVEAAERFDVARGTVAKWMKAYREGGKRALSAKKQGRPRGHGRLKGWQAATIVRSITDRTPDQLKMPFVLWTREAVAQLVESRYGVKVSLVTIGRWLKRWGFTPQKPVRRAWEQDSRAVDRWLREEYPQIRKDAKRKDAEIHWGDEMGMRSDHQTGRSFGLKGKTPIISGTGRRFSCNMISTVTNRGVLRFMVFQERFTSKVFIKFLNRLIKSSKGPIFLVVDGHSVHKSRKVKTWLSKHVKSIRIFFLPPYSPELNPDELLNNDVKSNAVGRRRPSCKDELISGVRSYLRSTQKQPDIVRKYFHAPSVKYAMG